MLFRIAGDREDEDGVHTTVPLSGTARQSMQWFSYPKCPRAIRKAVWIAVGLRPRHDAPARHCEERSDAAIQTAVPFPGTPRRSSFRVQQAV
jgi:hypothetical protein